MQIFPPDISVQMLLRIFEGAVSGMLVVKTIAKVRRAFFVQSKSIKQICRELRVSRNMVRKVVRSGATEFSYDRSTQPRPKIGPWRSNLDDMLPGDARHSNRERITPVRIYEELRNRGYKEDKLQLSRRGQYVTPGLVATRSNVSSMLQTGLVI